MELKFTVELNKHGNAPYEKDCCFEKYLEFKKQNLTNEEIEKILGVETVTVMYE